MYSLWIISYFSWLRVRVVAKSNRNINKANNVYHQAVDTYLVRSCLEGEIKLFERLIHQWFRDANKICATHKRHDGRQSLQSISILSDEQIDSEKIAKLMKVSNRSYRTLDECIEISFRVWWYNLIHIHVKCLRIILIGRKWRLKIILLNFIWINPKLTYFVSNNFKSS